MDFLENCINHKKKVFFVIIISIASIVCFYYSFINHDIGKAPAKSIAVTKKIIHNVSTPVNSLQSAPKKRFPGENDDSKSEDSVEVSDTLPLLIENNESSNIVDMNDSKGENLKELFRDSTINEHTVRISKMMQMKFVGSSHDMESHYAEVKEFLKIQLDDDAKVEELLDFYVKLTEYEMSIVNNLYPLWLENPETIDDVISLNIEKQQYRQNIFGQEVADMLWGHEMMVSEYEMRKLEIMQADIYGEEKEELIAALKENAWGDEAGEQDQVMSPVAQYDKKLALYREDLMNMPDQDRKEMMKKFRHEIFPPDEAKRLDFLESKLESDPEMKNMDFQAMEQEYALELEQEGL